MRTETITTIQSVAIADPATTPEDVKRIVAACRAVTPKTKRMGTVSDAAEILGVHPRTVQRYERMGLFKAIRITRRRVRYDMDNIDRLSTEGVSS